MVVMVAQVVAALFVGIGALCSGVAALVVAVGTKRKVDKTIVPKVNQLAERVVGVTTLDQDEANGNGRPA